MTKYDIYDLKKNSHRACGVIKVKDPCSIESIRRALWTRFHKRMHNFNAVLREPSEEMI